MMNSGLQLNYDVDGRGGNPAKKISHLQQDAVRQQEYLRDIEEMLKMNRHALKFILKGNSNDSSKYKTNESANTTTSLSSNDRVKTLHQQIEKIMEQNQVLLGNMEKFSKERNNAQTQALLNELIAEEAQRHEYEVAYELEDKITDLRNMLQEKEHATKELERVKMIPETEDIYIKVREIIGPQEQNARLGKELNLVNQTIDKLKTNISRVREEINDLENFNHALTNELTKLRISLASPLMAKKQQMRNNLNSSFIDVIKESDDESSQLSSGEGDYSENVRKSSKLNLQINTENRVQVQENRGSVDMSSPSKNQKVSIPKLDLAKAKQIQEYNIKKAQQAAQIQQNQQLMKPVDKRAQELINTRQEQLVQMKKLLEREIILNKEANEKIDQQQRLNKELDILGEMDKGEQHVGILQGILHKVHRAYVKCGLGMKIVKQLQEKLQLNNGQVNNNEQIIGNDREVNISILEIEEDNQQNHMGLLNNNNNINNNNSQNSKNIFYERGSHDVYRNAITKEHCKLFLLGLAKEIHLNPQIKNYFYRININSNNNKQYLKGKIGLRRSVSNPLDYIANEKIGYIYSSYDDTFHPNKLNIEQWKKNQKKLKKHKPSNKNLKIMEELNLTIQHNNNNHTQQDETPISNVNTNNKINTNSNSNHNNHKHFFGNRISTNNQIIDEISFTLDFEEFKKARAHEISFISNEDNIF